MASKEKLLIEQIPRLRRYARALLGDAARADDLVQDTLERAWGRLTLWRSGSDIRAWLFTIMHNLFVNQARRERVRTNEPLSDAERELASVDRTDHVMALRDLDAALRQLPHDYREVVLLVGLEQMRYEEAAKVLGVPVGTVMSRLSRGRERLRASMSGAGPGTLRRVK